MGRITLLSCITLWMVAKCVSDFKLGIQAAHKADLNTGDCDTTLEANWGDALYSALLTAGGAAPDDWAWDVDPTTPGLGSNDPDCWRIGIEGSISATDPIKDLDIRFCIEVIDHLEIENPTEKQAQNMGFLCTAWATEGGGWSDWRMDYNCWDFDGARVQIETRARAGLRITDATVGLRVADGPADVAKGNCGQDKDANKGPAVESASLDNGGGWTDWTGDIDTKDPDALKIYGGFDYYWVCEGVGLWVFAADPHSCQCQAVCDEDTEGSYCNSVSTIAQALEVVVELQDLCDAGEACCCSCQNCFPHVSV